MRSLNEANSEHSWSICTIYGSNRLVNRITSIGLAVGSRIEVISNPPNYPVLVFCRDTMIAINKIEAEKILVEEIIQ